MEGAPFLVVPSSWYSNVLNFVQKIADTKHLKWQVKLLQIDSAQVFFCVALKIRQIVSSIMVKWLPYFIILFHLMQFDDFFCSKKYYLRLFHLCMATLLEISFCTFFSRRQAADKYIRFWCCKMQRLIVFFSIKFIILNFELIKHMRKRSTNQWYRFLIQFIIVFKGRIKFWQVKK